MTTTSLMPIYTRRLPVTFERGEGIWLWDQQGNQYLDAISGIGVCSLGHCHPDVTQTIHEQSGKLLHTSNIYTIALQETLAELLTSISGMDQVFYGNSGSESIEAAIKMTRSYARKKGITRPIIITLMGSFHGRTMAAISASGSKRLKEGFEPLLEQFIHIPINDLQQLHDAVSANKNDIVAILLEPIQGDGGIREANKDFLIAIRALCDQHDYLMILDEVQTGLCRTGMWFACQHHGILPDILTVAKALGNGIPISAYLARGKANDLIASKHGSTFAGSPFVCAVATTVLTIMKQQKIYKQAAKVGAYLKSQLQQTFENHPNVLSIRGMGLMLGLELNQDCVTINKTALNHRVLLNVVSNRTIRLLPPLIFTEHDANELCLRLRKTVDDFVNV